MTGMFMRFPWLGITVKTYVTLKAANDRWITLF